MNNPEPVSAAPLSELLDSIEQRANAATPGPWEFVNRDDNQFVNSGNINICALAGIWAHTEDCQFIAAARTDVPALVKALRRAVAALYILDGANALSDIAQLLSEPADSVRDGNDKHLAPPGKQNPSVGAAPLQVTEQDLGVKETDVSADHAPKQNELSLLYGARLESIFSCLSGRYPNITTIESGLDASACERQALSLAVQAARAFIESHVADPDITEEMIRKYADYQEAEEHLKRVLSEHLCNSPATSVPAAGEKVPPSNATLKADPQTKADLEVKDA